MRVTVVGSVNMDLVARAPELPAPGETVLGGEFSTGPGGKGSNQAIAAARAGAAVSFVGAVGDDGFGAALREVLTDNRVDADLLRTVPGPSGVALIVVDGAGENAIVVAPGANADVTELSPSDLDRITGSDVLLCQLELPLDSVTRACVHARSVGVTVMVNPSPAQPLPSDLVAAVDVLVVNETEARQIGSATLDRTAHVVTTLGGHGASWRGPDGEYLHFDAPPVSVVDTTGAGDAFAGTLAAGWHLGPREAMRRAVVAGSLATTRAGAVSSPTAAEVDGLIHTIS